MRTFLAALCALLGVFFACAQEAKKEPIEKAAPYYPTPMVVAERMLRLGEIKKGEKVFDLGSGDGRIVVMAAQKFGARAVGVEYDLELYNRSLTKVKSMGLELSASFIHGDLFKQDYSTGDLLTVYLLPHTNVKLTPVLDKMLKKGARVVAHDFEFAEWNAEKTETMEDEEGRTHTLFIYRR